MAKSDPRAGQFPARRFPARRFPARRFPAHRAECPVLPVARCLASPSPGLVLCQAAPGRFPRCPRPRQAAGRDKGSDLEHPGLVPGLATTRSARLRPAWDPLAVVRAQGSPLARASLVLRARPAWRRRPGRRTSWRVRHYRRAPAARSAPDGWPGRDPAVLVTVVRVQAVRVLADRGQVRAACRPGPSERAPAVLEGQAVLAVPAVLVRAPGLAAVVAVQGLVVAVLAAAVARRARRVPVPEGRRGLAVPAGAGVPERKALSGVRADVLRGAGSRRSSVVKSLTTCRRLRSAACRSRAERAR